MNDVASRLLKTQVLVGSVYPARCSLVFFTRCFGSALSNKRLTHQFIFWCGSDEFVDMPEEFFFGRVRLLLSTLIV